MESYKPFIYGSLSGGIGYLGTLPLDFIKQHVQSTNSSSAVLKIIREKGFMYTFRGGLLGLYSIVPQMAIKFTAFDILKKNTTNNIWTNGFIAGFLDGSFLGPVLSIQTMQQMNSKLNYKKSFKLFFSNMNKNHQLIYPMALRNAIYTSTLFGTTDVIKKNLYVKDKYSFTENFMIASLGNIPAVLLCSASDVVRAQQITRFIQNKEYTVSNVCKTIMKNQGPRGFYAGIGSLYINFALRFPLTYALYQHFINL
jgi:hypothetical protein